MSNEFFERWKTWEKLVFVRASRHQCIRATDISPQVLACAIVVTILLGCAKLFYAHWRLRRYATVDKERKEQVIHRQMSQRRKSPGWEGEAAFGIRALERGLEIEGVWISPADSPKHLTRDGSSRSSLYEYPTESIDLEDLEGQTSVHSRDCTTADSTADAERGRLSSVHVPSPAKVRQPNRSSRDHSSDTSVSNPVRSRHPPLSFARYQDSPYVMRRQPSGNASLQGLEAYHNPAISINKQSTSSTRSSLSSDQSYQDSTDRKTMCVSTSALLNGRGRFNSRRSSLCSSDRDLLDIPRVSQAAETGQFTPRGRASGKAYSLDFAAPTLQAPTSTERLDLFATPCPAERTSGDPVPPKSAMIKSQVEASTAPVRRASMPDPIPFTQFCKKAPPSPRLGPSRDDRANSICVPSLKSHPPNDLHSGLSSPIIPASEGAAELKLPPLKRGSFEKQPSLVIRGHGSGFEILKPGSLNAPALSKHSTEESRSTTSVSLRSVTRSRSESIDSRKKVRKKERFSVDSSRRSRISLLLSKAS